MLHFKRNIPTREHYLLVSHYNFEQTSQRNNLTILIAVSVVFILMVVRENVCLLHIL